MASMSCRKKRSTHEGADENVPPCEKRPKVERLSQPFGHASSEEEEEDGGDSQSLGDLSQVSSQDMRTASKEIMRRESAEIGVIEKVQMRDFMCHQRLDVPLSPNVNFILGRNGSGKSAIMAALIVALGGKAAATLRGSSLKHFIKSGCQSAEVTVVLRNRGTEAFQPDKYGDKITIIRTLKANGVGSYRLKGAAGNVISTKKEDLIAILDHCNIQIDNPVSLLNQDTSRNFLRSSNPEANYKLFMKATHLEQIARDYEAATENQRLMREKIERKKTLIPEYQSRAKVLEEKVKEFERLNEMEGRIEELEKERQWALVIEIENKIPPFEGSIRQLTGKIPRYEQKVTAAEVEVTQSDEQLQGLGEGLEKVVGEASETQQRRSEHQSEKRTKDRAVVTAQNALKATKRKIAEKVKEKSALEQAKNDCLAASQRDYQGEREARQQRQQELRNKIKRAEDEQATVDNDRKQFEHALGHCRDTIRENQGHVTNLESQLKSSEERLRHLQSSRNDKLQVFGSWMRSLVDAIARNRQRFHKMPKGPIGSLMSLRDYRWATCVEAVVGRRMLFSFITDNHDDDRTLKQLMKQVIRDKKIFLPDTICSHFEGQMYDVRANRPSTQYPTVLDMLDVQDPDVMNTLINECGVESILLIETRAEAARVMERERPAKVSRAYTIDGDEVQFGRFYSNKKRPLGIIKASVDDAVREETGRRNQLKGDLDQARNKSSQLQQDARKNQHQLEIAKKRIWKAQTEKNRLQQSLLELQNAEEEEETQEDLATYEIEIQECRERVEALEREMEEKKEAVTAAKGEVDECEKRIREIEAEADEVTKKMEDFRKKHVEWDQKRKRADGHRKHFLDKVQSLRTEIQSLETQVTETRRQADDLARQASEVCDRIETSRSQKTIKKEIFTLRKRLEREEPSLNSREEIEQQYVDAMELFKKTTTQIKEQRSALRELHKSLNDRVSNYNRLQQRIVERACLYFTHFLQQRDYDGKLKFNHEKEKLEIQVQVDTKSQASQVTKNTRALSGGERSFTTICFIMSLWDSIEAPFRCLDEFDVFMDLFNRRISMRLMLDHAEDQPDRQFIFFTPQDMSSVGVRTRSNVKIFRLSEPERGQTTLD